MKRLLLSVGTAVLLTMGAASAAGATAPPGSPPTPPPTPGVVAEVNPIVGTWTLTDTSDPESTPFTGAFLSEGVYVEVDTGDVAIGVWEATGPNTVVMSYTGRDEDGTVIVRASITVDGDNATADYTLEFVGEDGPTGQYGPGHVTATRDAIDPMGAPVGTLDELFAMFSDGSTPPTT